MQVKIIITNECHTALLRNAEGGGFTEPGKRLSDGNWEIPLHEDTFDRLQEMKMEGETLSDTILRAVSYKEQNGKMN